MHGDKGIRSQLKRLYYQTPVQSLVLKALAPWRPAPWATDTMEFDYGLWLGASSLRCESGRQLGEENVWPTLFRRHVPTDYNVTKMRGSRAGLIVNMSALHLVMRAWPEAMTLMKSLRDSYVLLQPHAIETLSLEDFYVLSKVGCGLPAYLVRRRPTHVTDGTIPALVGTQFKLIAGFFMTMQHNLWAREGARMAFEDAATFFDYADQHNIFTSPGGRACGGSRRKILELYDALYRVNRPVTQEPLAALVDVDSFLSYAVHAVHLELTMLDVHRHIKAAYLEATSASEPDADNLHSEIAWLRDTRTIERTLNRVEQMQTSSRIDPMPSERLRVLARTASDALASPADTKAHYRDFLPDLQRYAVESQSRILELLNRAPLKTLPMAVIERRLDVTKWVGGS